MIGVGLIQSGRRILAPNIALASTAFDDASWAKSFAGTGSNPVVEANAVTAPDGTMTADRVTLALNGGTAVGDISMMIQTQLGLLTTGRSYRARLWGRVSTGTASLLLRHAAGGSYGVLSLTTTWQAFDRIETAFGPDLYFEIGLRGGQGGSDAAVVELWGAELVLR